ncbi:hypothetical protein Tco_1170771 [Tanacetum coccineum]
MLLATPKLLSGIEDSHHGPNDAMHNPPQPFKVEKTLVSKLTEIHSFLSTFSLRVDPYGFEDSYKMVWRYLIPVAAQGKSRFIAACSYSTDKLLKLKTSRKMTIKAFKDQEKYEHVGPKVTSAQDDKSLQVDNERLCLVDNLKNLKDHLQVKQAQSLKSKSTSISHKIKKSRLRAQD